MWKYINIEHNHRKRLWRISVESSVCCINLIINWEADFMETYKFRRKSIPKGLNFTKCSDSWLTSFIPKIVLHYLSRLETK